MSEKSNLYKKLVQVLNEVGTVKKSGRNKFHGYNYVMESDLLELIRGQLIEKNIFIFTSSKVLEVKEVSKKTDSGKEDISFITTVETTHTFVDGDSGEQFSVKSVGQGHDNLDKGVFKAITGANKYFMMKNFLVATGDDPEKDDKKQSNSSFSKKSSATKPKGFGFGEKPAKPKFNNSSDSNESKLKPSIPQEPEEDIEL